FYNSMAKKKKLTALQQGEILYSHNHGESYSTIARNVKYEKTTVHDILKRAEAGTTVVKKRPGRKPIFDTPALEELKRLVTQDTNHRRLSAREIQELWNKEKNQTVSISTIRRALKKTGLRSCVAHESFFRQFSSSHNIRVWRTSAEEFDESCLVLTVSRSPGLYTQFMRKYAMSAIHQLVPNRKGIFQQDNTPSHKSRKAIDFFDNADISMLLWPLQSPDLNPLENLWQEVESRLHSSLDKPTSIEDLEEKVKATWNSIPPRYYRGLVNSMPNQ
ncbi:13062_t:CDS:2, partial [Racocetra persica]